ncbi:MAG TPA: ribokinase [Aggregatilineales bacterium]|nr:ribokinase [Aggregatilineales bacterium]
MPAHVVVVGSLNMDLVVRAPRIPAPGETLLGGEFHTVPGGKGANQAVAAARLGARVSMVGRLGADDFATQLLANLEADGIDHSAVIQDASTTTGVALIVVADDGQNSIVVASGANMQVTPGDVDAAAETIAAADVLLLQLEIPLDAVQRAAEIAHEHGVPVVLNPAPARDLPADLLSRVDVLIPNESETALLTGLPVDTGAELEAAARALLDRGISTAILTLGARGAMLATGSEVEIIPTFKVQPVDTTAAGDAFVAGFSVALAEGKPVAEAVRWGNAAGALAVTRMGAQTSLPRRAELEQLLLQQTPE